MRVPAHVSARFRDLVALRLGLAFSDARQADLARGLLQACQSSQLLAPEAYVDWLVTLSSEHSEWGRLANYLTVGETYFFRDPALFETLETRVLPALIAARRAQGVLQLRVWSAGCATGEEAYSLAILLDRLLPDRSRWALTILATDVNLDAMRSARNGIYRKWSFRSTPEWVRSRYFRRRDADTFEVTPDIRQTVVFVPLNLNDASYPAVMTNTAAMDLIVCRNVLMYLTGGAQRATVARLHDALVIGGWLVVSPVEASADLLRALVPVQFPGVILYRRAESAGIDLLSDAKPAAVPVVEPSFETSARPEAAAVPVHEKAPAEPASLLHCARMLADRGRLDDAHSLCERVLAADRLDPDAHLLLAAICQERGDVGAAVDAVRRALYVDPRSASGHFLLGSLLLRRGEQQRGQRSMQTVVDLLRSRPRDEVVSGTDGLSTGPLLEMARACLELGR